MTNTEMSSMFDTLLNSYATRGLFGETASGSINLDEYEKSVYLTQAQDIIVKSYFDKTLNPQGQGFDDSARRQVDFSSLIEVKNIDYVGNGSGTPTTVYHSTDKIWGGNEDELNTGDDYLGTIRIKNKTNNDLNVVLKTISDTSFVTGGVSAGNTEGSLVVVFAPLSKTPNYTLAELIANTQNAFYSGNNLSDFLELSLVDGEGNDTPSTDITAEFGTIPGSSQIYPNTGGFDDRGRIYKMPVMEGTTNISDVLFILNEKLIATDGYGDKTDFVIVPINYQEYDREMSKAYAQPLKKQAWRLFQNIETGFDIYSELIPRFDTDMTGAIYRVRYVRRPKPIVLSNLDGLSIEGETDESSCELNPILHMDIVQKAVELVYATRGARTSSNNS